MTNGPIYLYTAKVEVLEDLDGTFYTIDGTAWSAIGKELSDGQLVDHLVRCLARNHGADPDGLVVTQFSYVQDPEGSDS